jgi:hypothetical protein
MKAVKAWVITIDGQLDDPSILQLYNTKRDAEFDRVDGTTQEIVRVEIRAFPPKKRGRSK